MNPATADYEQHREQLDLVAAGRNANPFAVLGLHRSGAHRVVRTFQPYAEKIELIGSNGVSLGEMQHVSSNGIFIAAMPPRKKRYLFRITYRDGSTHDLEDAYRFPPSFGEIDLYLLGEGSDRKIYEKMGAHVRRMTKIPGVQFAVWAPNASRVSVVGDFNGWDGRVHCMRLHPANGIWEIFVPGIGAGTKYKFELQDKHGKLLPLKADPYGSCHEAPPGNASIVFDSSYRWQDGDWMQQRSPTPDLDQPVSIYEVHLGSWMRKDNNAMLSYRELSMELVDYVKDMGFTHVEFLPVSEHPFDGSWGYQPIGMFAPTHRFGDPDDFRHLVDCCHRAGIGVIVDWVPAHFPRDEHGLGQFDGTALYEHDDPRKGAHADWGTLIFNFGRREVVNYLIGCALYWIEQFHIDAIRVDAVASMLYLDYSRKDGEWLPNELGGRENLEAVEFLKQLNTVLHAHGATSFAEESTAWPGVSRPVDAGGLGFTYKWNMGWMNDTLSYMSEDPLHRKYHHDKMTFGLVYAYSENFVLPLSHDEVVHGKRSLLERMPGDEWQRFANLRAYLANMYAHPGKKLLFMGGEIAQCREWNHDESLDWHLTADPQHAGVQTLIRDLNNLYKATPALYAQDFSAAGFEWLDGDNRDESVLSWLRRDKDGGYVICISNFTPVARPDFSIGVPQQDDLEEILNTDDERYGGSGVTNHRLAATTRGRNARPCSVSLHLPPLATLLLRVAR